MKRTVRQLEDTVVELCEIIALLKADLEQSRLTVKQLQALRDRQARTIQAMIDGDDARTARTVRLTRVA